MAINYSDSIVPIMLPADISKKMRADWNRRIAQDYRFWMSDGYSSDQAMWESGQRDYKILLQDYNIQPGQVLLEIGCGVGRILRPASKDFSRVIGIDVSEEAISKASELLGQSFNLELKVGSGLGLEGVNKNSVDVVISFAALGCIPTDVVARYLMETQRVLKTGGEARFQLYLGKTQEVTTEDTLYLRCYDIECARAAFEQAGFSVKWIRELDLPFQASSPELGIQAVIISLIKLDKPGANPELISKTLLPAGEKIDHRSTFSQDLEHMMLVNYAKELAERGDLTKAQQILEGAVKLAPAAEAEANDILDSILQQQSANKKETDIPAINFSSDSCLESNMRVIADRFPECVGKIKQVRSEDMADLSIAPTAEGPSLNFRLQNLDHPTKPVKGAERWASQILSKAGDGDKGFTVVGAGMGYHLEAILKEFAIKNLNVRLDVVEPSAAVLRFALENRDCRVWLSKINSLQIGTNAKVPDQTGNIEFRIQVSTLFPEICDRLRNEFYGQRGLSVLKPNIAVVGPFHGGTLPIMQYVTLSLQLLGQRVRPIDVSCFDQGYGQLEGFVKDKLRRAPVENMYYEMVSQIVLESVNEKPVDILFCMALAPISPRVLNELRSRGVITVLWFVEDYQRFTYWQQVAPCFDYVFTIQKGKCIEAIRAAGAKEVAYMPVACEPNVHAPLVLSSEDKQKYGSALSFMGAGYHNRQQMFASLVDFDFKIWGTEWPDCKPFDRMVQQAGQRLTPGEYVKVFNSSKINLNLHSSNERDGVDPFGDFVNPRTFELAACESFQLIDNRQLLPELFDIGKELITFDSANDLKEKIRYYLNHDQERLDVARRSRQRVLKDHTYQQRLKDMLSIIYSRSFESLKQRQEESAWTKMLKRASRHEELSKRCQKAFERGEQPNLDGLISDIVAGQGKLSDTEKKLLFMYHLRKQIVRHAQQDAGEK